MSESWYYRLLGEEFGPVTSEELEELLTSGRLDDNDQIRADSSHSWQPISVALHGAEPAEEAMGGDLNIDDFVFEAASEPESSADGDLQQISALDDLSFEFGDSGEAKPATPPPVATPQAASPPPPPIAVPSEAPARFVPDSADEDDSVAEDEVKPRRRKRSSPKSGDTDPNLSDGSRTVVSGEEPRRKRPSQKKKPTKKRRPKKKKPDGDEELEGIFDEVFSEEEPPPKPTSPAPVASTPAEAPAPAAAPMPATGAAAAAAAAAPAAARPQPKKRSGGGMSLPDPKMLITGFAAVAGIAAVCWSLGLFGGGGLSLSFGGADFSADVDKLMEQFNKLNTASSDDPNWSAFASSANTEGAALIESVRKSGSLNTKGMKARRIAQISMQLARTSDDEQDQRDELAETLRTEYESFKSL